MTFNLHGAEAAIRATVAKEVREKTAELRQFVISLEEANKELQKGIKLLTATLAVLIRDSGDNCLNITRDELLAVQGSKLWIDQKSGSITYRLEDDDELDRDPEGQRAI